MQSKDQKAIKDAYLCLGCVLLAQGKYREGTETIAKTFKTPKVLKRAGNSQTIQGKGGKRKLIEVDESSNRLHKQYSKRGNDFFRAEYYEDALGEYLKALKHDPEGGQSNWNLAKVHIVLDNYKGRISDETVKQVKIACEKIPGLLEG